MREQVKQTILILARLCLGFALARRLTAGRLRILCYHSFGLADEQDFRPGLFLRPEVLDQRLDWLRRKGYPVLPLAEAFDALEAGRLRTASVTITIDDGMAGVVRHAAPVLQRHGVPSTLYLTTFHHERQTPVFDVALSYLIWKSERPHVDPCALPFSVPDPGDTVPLDARGRARIEAAALAHAADLDHDEREVLARAVGDALGVSYDTLREDRTFTIMNADEVRRCQAAGVAVQLHTHTHHFPTSHAVARSEIEENARRIAPLAPGPLDHFCYPSGEWSPAHFAILRSAGLRTATTCDTGLARRDSPPFALPRILDSSRVSQVEFEAEMSGFLDLLRDLTRRLKGTGRTPGPATEPA